MSSLCVSVHFIHGRCASIQISSIIYGLSSPSPCIQFQPLCRSDFWNQRSWHDPSYLCIWRQPVSSTRRNKLPSSVWREVSVVTPDIKRLSEKKSKNVLVSKCFLELYWVSVFIVSIVSRLPKSLLDLRLWSGKCQWLHVVRLLSEWCVCLLPRGLEFRCFERGHGLEYQNRV